MSMPEGRAARRATIGGGAPEITRSITATRRGL
jgi:hypothetical protein